MGNPYGIDVAALMNAKLGPMFDDATLTVRTRGTATAGNETAGTNPTTADKTCKAQIEDADERQRDGTIIQNGRRSILILADSIEDAAVPKPNDDITLPVGGTVYRIAKDGVSHDAFQGVYVCRVLR